MKMNHKADVAPAKSGQHTPTPWETCECWPFPDDAGRRFAAVIKRFQRYGYKDQALICSFEHSVFRDSALANAAFIVQACNAHEKLVEALRDCLPDLEHYATTHGPGPDRRLEQARAALALVERK